MESGHIIFLLLQGSRFDLITLGLIMVLPLPLAAIFRSHLRSWVIYQKIMLAYFTVAASLIVFLELVTPAFIDQFDIRPNILFVEYLKYPKEVFSMLGKGYLFELCLALIIVPVVSATIFFWMRGRQHQQTAHWLPNLVMMPLFLLLCAMMIRSTLGHRPANPSMVAASNDLMINSLALNSFYSLAYAIYYSQKDERSELRYSHMNADTATKIIREQMFIDPQDFTNPLLPTLHRQKPRINREQPINLVIILEESLGAEFVGSMGGLPLTPNLDKLAKEGIWFEQMYATGTRSVRGIEAVITGFLPTPAMSVVKLQKSQRNFFTIAELLRQQDYETSFFYGGEAHFDNMRSFFVGNGFEKIVEQKDMTDADFVATWGASDEDLFNKAHEYFNEVHERPFFSLVFSSSNHSPFEFPEGKIELYEEPQATVNNAVKYADYALGQFFNKAKASDYWKNTLFVVVADHNSRVYGPDLVPIERFHIPALILGADTQPQRYKRIASQIDLVPTLLSLMGIESTHPAIGYDLLRDDLGDFPGRAIMQYNATQAYMEGDQVIVLQNQRKPTQYHYSHRKLVAQEKPNAVLEAKALAHSVIGPMLYHQALYRLEAKPTSKSPEIMTAHALQKDNIISHP